MRPLLIVLTGLILFTTAKDSHSLTLLLNPQQLPIAVREKERATKLFYPVLATFTQSVTQYLLTIFIDKLDIFFIKSGFHLVPYPFWVKVQGVFTIWKVVIWIAIGTWSHLSETHKHKHTRTHAHTETQTHTYTHICPLKSELSLCRKHQPQCVSGVSKCGTITVQILHSLDSSLPHTTDKHRRSARSSWYLTVTRGRRMRTSGDTHSLKAHSTYEVNFVFKLVMPRKYENHTQHNALNMEVIPHPLSSYNTFLACLLVGIMIRVLVIQTFQVQMGTLTILFFDVNCVCGEFLQRMRRGTVCKNWRVH